MGILPIHCLNHVMAVYQQNHLTYVCYVPTLFCSIVGYLGDGLFAKLPQLWEAVHQWQVIKYNCITCESLTCNCIIVIPEQMAAMLWFWIESIMVEPQIPYINIKLTAQSEYKCLLYYSSWAKLCYILFSYMNTFYQLIQIIEVPLYSHIEKNNYSMYTQ